MTRPLQVRRFDGGKKVGGAWQPTSRLVAWPKAWANMAHDFKWRPTPKCPAVSYLASRPLTMWIAGILPARWGGLEVTLAGPDEKIPGRLPSKRPARKASRSPKGLRVSRKGGDYPNMEIARKGFRFHHFEAGYAREGYLLFWRPTDRVRAIRRMVSSPHWRHAPTLLERVKGYLRLMHPGARMDTVTFSGPLPANAYREGGLVAMANGFLPLLAACDGDPTRPILVRHEADASKNGVYLVKDPGGPDRPWALLRLLGDAFIPWHRGRIVEILSLHAPAGAIHVEGVTP